MGLCCSGHGAVMSETAFVFEGNAYIGKGSHSKVFRAKHKASGDVVAIKMIVKDAARHEWQHEVSVMKMLDVHPNVIELKGTYETDGAYSEEIARKFTRDTLLALEFLHDQGIVHGDLKPENLLVTSKHAQKARVKLADFSMAAIISAKRLVDKDGLTWAYCAPEVLGAADDDAPYAANSKRDMWSVGVILYIMLSAMHPFDPNGRAIVAGILTFQMVNLETMGWVDVSTDAKDLIRRLLCRDPTKRLSAKEALQHPWFAHESAPTLPLQCSLRGGLNVYVRSMHARFRELWGAAMNTHDDHDLLDDDSDSIKSTKYRLDQTGKNENARRRAVQKLGSEDIANEYSEKFNALSRSIKDPEFVVADEMIKDLLMKDFSQNEIRQLLHVGCGRIIRVEKEYKLGIKPTAEEVAAKEATRTAPWGGKKAKEKRARTTTSALEAQYSRLEVLNMKSLKSLHLMLRDRRTPHAQFKHFADRLMRILAEESLASCAMEYATVWTPTGAEYSGMVPTNNVCAVSIIRAGDALLDAVLHCVPSIAVGTSLTRHQFLAYHIEGKILIQRNENTIEKSPILFYSKLPPRIAGYGRVLLVDPMLATGGSAKLAIQTLINAGVEEQNIVFANVVACPHGIHAVFEEFPHIKIVTSALDPDLNEYKYIVPGLGDYGDRYYNTLL
ncbi:hypothetical protein DYB37_000422 [Aphanomyces astaci]|uniref:uracil phosphoribosyltransferase n=2 Tax=Aphanomyces astaci TaxID=112090 RepID=A0A418F978_APHAT|nr:hypothetical protein DYB37_000422 [Aphanomyces astaci]